MMELLSTIQRIWYLVHIPIPQQTGDDGQSAPLQKPDTTSPHMYKGTCVELWKYRLITSLFKRVVTRQRRSL